MNRRNRSSFRNLHEIVQIKNNIQNALNYLNTDGQINADVCNFLLLTIYIPINPRYLMSLKAKNFISNQNVLVISKPNPNSRRVFPISNSVFELINKFAPLHTSNEYIFKNLLAMQKSARDKLISNHISYFWSYFEIRLDDFRYFFEHYAIKNVCLKSEFIESTLKGTTALKEQANHAFKILLMDWWFFQINDL